MTSLKNTLLVTCAALSLCAMTGVARAEEEASSPFGTISGSVALTNDYVWRGFSQTNENPAVQGGLTWAHDIGLYAGVWGSSVNFGDGTDASIEVDFTAGFSKSLGALTYDIGYVYYYYPGDHGDANFGEVYGSLSYDLGFAVPKVGVFYSWDSPIAKSTVYPYFEVKVPVVADGPLPLSLFGHIGRYSFKGAGGDYTDWNVGVTTTVLGIDVSVGYYDTNIDAYYADSGKASGFRNISNGRVSVLVSKSF